MLTQTSRTPTPTRSHAYTASALHRSRRGIEVAGAVAQLGWWTVIAQLSLSFMSCATFVVEFVRMFMENGLQWQQSSCIRTKTHTNTYADWNKNKINQHTIRIEGWRTATSWTCLNLTRNKCILCVWNIRERNCNSQLTAVHIQTLSMFESWQFLLGSKNHNWW